ncbi:MAG: YkgJ family cysteine cluster protein [Dehalococcoidia bacterium]|nr:YkgJ family cysteine cluster protein [Dehalococcoidia bacterium]
MRVDDLERMAKDIETGKTPTLRPEDTFNFACDMCGICCTNIDILLTPYDLVRLRRYLECTTTDLIRQSLVEVFPGGQSRVPLAMLTFQPIGDNLHVCPFLAHVADRDKLTERMAGREEPTLEDLEAAKVPGKMACAIYPARPGVCRSSPLGRVVSFYQDASEERAWRDQKVILVSPCPDCRGLKADTSVTVTEWLERNGVLPYWQASRGHQQVSALMVEKGLRLPEKDSVLPEGARAALMALWHMAAATLYDFDAVSAVASKFPQNRQHEDFREDLSLLANCQEMVRGLTEIAALCHQGDQGQGLPGGDH